MRFAITFSHNLCCPLRKLALLAAALTLGACQSTSWRAADADATTADAALLPTPADVAGASVAAAPLFATPAKAPRVAASSAADEVLQPIIIRGSDQLISTSGKADAPVSGPAVKLSFENAPIAEVVKVLLGELLHADYLVHPPIDGMVTLSTQEKVSADRALFLLEQALQANGIVIARDARGAWHVGRPEALQGIVSVPKLISSDAHSLPPGWGTIVISPQYLGAGELANILQPVAGEGAIVRVDGMRNLLVMRGTRTEAEGWLDIVRTFDVNLLRGMSVGVFPLRHATTSEVDAALQLLMGSTVAGTKGSGRANARSVSASAPAAGMNALGSERSPLYGALRIVPIERINALLVISPRAAYLDEMRYWIEQFDRPNANSAEPQLFVYKVQNSSADHLAELLNGIYGGLPVSQKGAKGTKGTGVAPSLSSTSGATANSSFASGYGATLNLGGSLGKTNTNTDSSKSGSGADVTTSVLGDTVRVMADRINNTLLIHASPAEYVQIEATLKRLDVQRAQVLLEASIVEVTLSDGLEYGLQWAFHNGVHGGRNGVGLLGPLAGQEGTQVIPGSAGTFTYTISNAAGNISAVLSALASRSLVRIISSPSLMVLDNHTAAIQVGSQEPVSTGRVVNTSSNYTSSSIQYKDTGVMLGVTPSVSAGGLVTLDINQIVSNLGGTSIVGGEEYPTFMQRQIASKVAVRSGETIVLGGLIRDEASRRKSGLPVLSSIPVVGALFGSHVNSTNRTELLVVITPRVLRSDEDARAVSRELRDKMRGLVLEPVGQQGRAH